MELEVGMFVRTNIGIITKIITDKQIKTGGDLCVDTFDGKNGAFIKIKDIKKASHNLIELVEVGDYVNECEVSMAENNRVEVIENYGDRRLLENKDIKTILTKELYASECYEDYYEISD